MYEEFLEYLVGQQGGWNALPWEVAAWWRTRDDLRLVTDGGGVRIEGDGAERARIEWAVEAADGIAFEPDHVRA